MLSRTMVAQLALDFEACDALVNVQVVDRFAAASLIFGAAVGAGAAAGIAVTAVAAMAIATRAEEKFTILICLKDDNQTR